MRLTFKSQMNEICAWLRDHTSSFIRSRQPGEIVYRRRTDEVRRARPRERAQLRHMRLPARTRLARQSGKATDLAPHAICLPCTCLLQEQDT